MKTGRLNLANVYVARMRDDPEYLVEFVDACGSNNGDRSRKWVIVISTQFGCPVKCLMCDAGSEFKGNLTFQDLKFQVMTVLSAHNEIDPQKCSKLKIQFARMGEPSLNDAVLELLLWLKDRYPNVIPCIATMTPHGRDRWFDRLLEIRDHFCDFQLQLSINSTDDAYRDKLMPYPKMKWRWLGDYGKKFFRRYQRKVCLNFALSPDIPVNADRLRDYFDPSYFLVKLTPINPTTVGSENQLTIVDDRSAADGILRRKSAEFESVGFFVIQSIGDMEENLIGSNCGQAVRQMKKPSDSDSLYN
ncbi:MAG: radical SAM protein [Desulfomonilaceae bacterium]